MSAFETTICPDCDGNGCIWCKNTGEVPLNPKEVELYQDCLDSDRYMNEYE